MPENLNSDSDTTATATEIPSSTEKTINQIILMGTPEWVKGMIYRFHNAGIAEAGNWSKIVPTKKVGEAIAILQRPRG